MSVARLSRLLWLVLLLAPAALATPLRARAGRPLVQAHPDLLHRDSARASAWAESAAGTRSSEHSSTAASRRAALRLGGRRVGRWSGSQDSAAAGRGLTASKAAEEEDPVDAAAAAEAEEEADEAATMLPESKAADAADPLIEAGHAEEDAEVSEKAAARGTAGKKAGGSPKKEGEKGGDKAATAVIMKAAQIAESILEPISAKASGGDDEKADSGGGGEGGGGEVSAADEETAEEEQEEVSAERVSLLESADDTAERVRATAASAVEHAKEASQAAAAKASRAAAWPRVSVGGGVAALKAWLEENSLEDYDLSACLALVFAALLVARVLWIRVRQKRQRPFGSPSPSGRPSRWRFGLGANRSSQAASPRPLAWHRSPGR